MEKKKILVCGATGFLGRNTAESLAKRDDLEVYGTYFNQKPYNNPNVKMVQADFCRKEHADKVTKGVDVVVQMAANISGAKVIVNQPWLNITDNVVMNPLILEAVHKNKVSHFIYPSCSIVYPSSDKPLKETDVDLNKGFYEKYFGNGWTKLYTEKLAEFYSKLGNTKVTVFRHSNVYGSYDKFDLEKSHVFGATMTKVMTAPEGGIITVWGTGEEERDLLYVADVVDFVEKAIDNQENTFELFNVGSKSSISISNLVKKIICASEKNLEIKYDTSKPTILTKIILDCSKAEEELGWKPKVSLEEGIKKTIHWYKRHILH